MKTRLTRLALVLTIGLAARAEMTFTGNPALLGRTDAMRINPALAAWRPLAFSADWQLLNAGLAGGAAAIGQGGFQLAVPRVNLVLLGDLRDTDLLSENELSLDWAVRLRSNLSLGLEAGVRRFGWNRERLGADALQDPVFRDGLDRLQPLLGAGLFWAPRTDLYVGLGLKRLNRPSLSLVSSAPKAPVRGYLGLAWQSPSLSLGLTVDNLANQTVGGGALQDLGSEQRPSLQAEWRAMETLSVYGDLRQDGLALEFATQPLPDHELAYRWTVPLGDLAERSDGSHRLEWTYSLGGALIPGGPWRGQPALLPGDEPREGAPWLEALRRRWRPERAPLLLRSPVPQLEVVELHVHVEPALLERLAQAGADPAALAASGLTLNPGKALTPDQSGVVNGTWSAAWWQLSGWLETLAWDEGVRPVIHVGDRVERLDDLANLLGAELEEQPLPRLPENGRLTLPDTLALGLELPEELARLARSWRLEAELPGQARVVREGRDAPPRRLQLALDPGTLEPGEARLHVTVADSRGRLLADRTLVLPVQLRVRHVHLSEQAPGAALPAGVDRIHIHLDEHE
ncbi:MAG: hypothetical protein WC326_14400 [Candidatus Delongbacteria bacterium]